jgi:hypothetical protein
LIPISETHLRLLLKEGSIHYNRSRPHMALGPGVPDPPPAIVATFGSAIPALDRRAPRGARQIDPWWLASRVFTRAIAGLIKFAEHRNQNSAHGVLYSWHFVKRMRDLVFRDRH